MKRLSTDSLVGAAIALTGCAALGMSFTFGEVTWGGESSRLFPLIVSVVLVGLGLRMAVHGGAAAPVRVSLDTRSLRVVGLILLGGVYIAMMAKLGYVLSTAVMMPLVFWLFGARSRIGLALSAVLGPLVFHLVFFKGLNVYPPYAPWLAPILSFWNT